MSFFADFFTESGLAKAGVFQFWRDVSWGAIDLRGSRVFGWLDMQYSYRANWMFGRQQWVDEAIRLTKDTVDLTQYYGIIAVINAPSSDSAIGNVARSINGQNKNFGLLALNMSDDNLGQPDWRHCVNCGSLFFAGNPSLGLCPGSNGGPHNSGGSSDYILPRAPAPFLPDPSESNWKWCHNCQGLVYAGDNTQPGACLGPGGVHSTTGSGTYQLVHDLPGFPYQTQWRRCNKCQGLTFVQPPAGVIGACPKGGIHDITASKYYTLFWREIHVHTTFAGHEMGHGFGLDHSFDNGPVPCAGGGRIGEYCDHWDIMGDFGYSWVTDSPYRGGGPGINAPTMHKFGWIPEERILTLSPPILTQSRRLVPLHRPDLPGFSMVNIVAPDIVYTVEFREPTAWDRSIPRPAILIHELKTRYTVGQPGWNWCSKCSSLFYNGNQRCAAGGSHDLAGSGGYLLPHDSIQFIDQNNWRWCATCGALAYLDAGRGPGICPSGGIHDHSHSSNYTVTHDLANLQDSQADWRHCTKCEMLAFAGNILPGACPAGGWHDLGSGFNYSVAFRVPSAILPIFQPSWLWCRKCQGIVFNGEFPCAAGGFHDPTGSWAYSVVIDGFLRNSQSGWRYCLKCQGMYYGGPGSSGGVCPADHAQHDGSASGDYSILEGSGSGLEDANWFHCRKCEILFNGNGGPCPKTGQHDPTGSSTYALPHFYEDLTYLVKGPDIGDWQPGMVFRDTARGVGISIESIDTAAGVAWVRI